MSAYTLVRVSCDGRSLGVACRERSARQFNGNIMQARAVLLLQGWTRRHHGDTQVDLCPWCSTRANVITPTNIGRPKKVSAP